jgi:hypothetical protein
MTSTDLLESQSGLCYAFLQNITTFNTITASYKRRGNKELMTHIRRTKAFHIFTTNFVAPLLTLGHEKGVSNERCLLPAFS